MKMTEEMICKLLPIEGIPDDAKHHKVLREMGLALAIMTGTNGNDIFSVLTGRAHGTINGTGIAIPINNKGTYSFEDFKKAIATNIGLATSANDDLDKIIAIAIIKNSAISMNFKTMSDFWSGRDDCDASLLVHVYETLFTIEKFLANKSILSKPITELVKITKTWPSNNSGILAWQTGNFLRARMNCGIYSAAYYAMDRSINNAITYVNDDKLLDNKSAEYPLGVDRRSKPITLRSYLKTNYNYKDIQSMTSGELWDIFANDPILKALLPSKKDCEYDIYDMTRDKMVTKTTKQKPRYRGVTPEMFL